MSGSEVLSTALGAGFGLISGAILALLTSRKRLEVEYDITLRKHRIDAYQGLWKILEPLAYFSPPSAVTAAVVNDLSNSLRTWYFEVGGLFLSETCREAYFDLQKGLGGVLTDPSADEFQPLDPERYERLRGLASRLRTTSTQDVATRVKPRLTAPLPARIARLLRRRRAVEVSVRRGWLWDEDQRECFSILITNQLPDRSVVVADVYFETPTRPSVLARPIRLGPGGHWEIAVPASSITDSSGDARELVRAELADGSVVKGSPGNEIEPHPSYLHAPQRTGRDSDAVA